MGCKKGLYGTELVCIPPRQSAKESLRLGSSLHIRGILGWRGARKVALLCCQSNKRGPMAGEGLYKQDFFLLIGSGEPRASSMDSVHCTWDVLCMITALALPSFSWARVPNATVTKSAESQPAWTVQICLESQGQPEQACTGGCALVAELLGWSCLG